LKLKYDKMLSNIGFNCAVRHYMAGLEACIELGQKVAARWGGAG